MIKRSRFISSLVALSFVLSMAVVPSAVMADTNTGDNGTDPPANASTAYKEASQKAAEAANAQAAQLQAQRQQEESQREQALKQSEQEQQAAQQKKDEAFQKACDNKVASYQTRMEDISTHAQKQADTLNAITDRVDAFYKSHNLTVANYTTLLTDVQTRRQLVTTLSATIQKDATDFTCGTSQAQAQANLAVFKDALKQEIAALQAYQVALKNLIVAVKTSLSSSSSSTTTTTTTTTTTGGTNQ